MKLRPFELGLVIIFLVLAMLALFLLATYKPGAKSDEGLAQVGTVIIWGTIPQAPVDTLLTQLREDNDAYRTVSYRYYNPAEFDSRLTNALADGKGPDVILVSQEKLVTLRRRIQPISYEALPVRDIRTNYVDGAEIFALSDGVYGLPVLVDPLMMYWNRDILATKGYLESPRTWETLVNSYFPQLIERDFDRTVRRSVVAMGEYSNTRNGYGVISALLLQAGSQMVIESTDGYRVQLQTSVNGGTDPLRSVADFYTRFSQPSNALYSWNRGFGEDRLQFVAEDLAFYFGYGSEGATIERINPNLNFDIAEIPQGANTTVRRTYAKFYAFSVLRASKNISGGYAVMQQLATAQNTNALAVSANMAPAHRSLVSAGSNDKYGRVVYQSASIALGWLNPNKSTVDGAFTTLAADINENRRDLSGAVSDASNRLKNAY